MSDYDKKCICGCPRSRHTYYDNNSGHCVDCGSMQCPEFRTAEEAKSEPAAESVYERARNELDLEECDCETCENWAHHEAVLSAITCGEAAEKRAVDAEKEIHNALALLKPTRPEDGLLPAIRDVLQRLVLAEDNHNE